MKRYLPLLLALALISATVRAIGYLTDQPAVAAGFSLGGMVAYGAVWVRGWVRGRANASSNEGPGQRGTLDGGLSTGAGMPGWTQ